MAPAARSTVAWHLFTLSRTLLAISGAVAGRGATLGPLASRVACGLRRVDRASAG